MQITDEEVAFALKHWRSDIYPNAETAMRAALEAWFQLKQKRERLTLPEKLRQACLCENVTGEERALRSHASTGLVLDAAACIEDLAEWVNKLAPPVLADRADHPARFTLKHWGLK